tara:strand:+ start:853 stop:3264 length:2412 start_codon:yes stop_codon:yes gene_type:complete
MGLSGVKNYFPSQVVSDIEKISYEYGLKVAKAIESEWFHLDKSSNRYKTNHNNFRKLRLYSRGEQSVQKYKDELSINGDLSYLNLDWKPVPIISKFVDIVVNGMSEKTYDIKAYSQDPFGIAQRTSYMEGVMSDLKNRKFNEFVAKNFNINLYKNEPTKIPQTEEELQLHMQLSYKQNIEIAQEQALDTLLAGSKYDLTRKRFYRDLTVLGIGAVKTTFNTSEGATVKYVDPVNLVYSYTDSPYFDDIYYVGEVKTLPINEVIKEFPYLKEEDIKDIVNTSNQAHTNRPTNNDKDDNQVQVLYFNYKTYMNEVYKVKVMSTGSHKAIKKDDSFNPPKDKKDLFTREERQVECLFEGALILGTNKLIKWERAANMMRPKSNFTKVQMNYSIVAPGMYEGRIESLVGRITGFADMIQLTHLKIQQVLSRMVPDGVYLDADGLAEIDLGNGTNYNPQEALNMFFQTGSVIGRSYTQDGDFNHGKVPIQEITSGSGGNKLQALIGNYNYYMQMIRDVTGLNEARDGSSPDANALVGIQKMAAANSNTATRHILQAGLFLTAEVCDQLSLRISDIIEYSPTKDAFIQQIGANSAATLEEMSTMHMYDFGIFIELQPDDEERAILENNIQAAIAKESIDLEDAIDIREIRNLKLANQLLKLRRKRKKQLDQKMQQQNMQMQSQMNQQSQQAAAQLDVQKNQALAQSEAQLEQMKAQIAMQMQTQEVQFKKDLMAEEFNYNMQLKNMELNINKSKDTEKENRKDQRTKIQASQQSELIDQRKNEKPPKNFESSGNDTLGGGFDLGSFDPR